MFAGFNVKIKKIDSYEIYQEDGLKLFKDHKKIITEDLGKYINPDGSLNEKEMESDWFPDVRAHVFLSHAHKDEYKIICFAGWLYKKFGIRSFIDSCVWGFSDQLLKSIDERYCVSRQRMDEGRKLYSYELRNVSTSNVHMILSTALVKMIDNTECLMFINTPSSVKWKEMTGNTAIESPWIYNELLISKLIRNRSRKAHRDYYLKRPVVLEHADSLEWPNVEYIVDTKHLPDIDDEDLKILQNSVGEGDEKYRAFHVLDWLYEYKGINLEHRKMDIYGC